MLQIYYNVHLLIPELRLYGYGKAPLGYPIKKFVGANTAYIPYTQRRDGQCIVRRKRCEQPLLLSILISDVQWST